MPGMRRQRYGRCWPRDAYETTSAGSGRRRFCFSWPWEPSPPRAGAFRRVRRSRLRSALDERHALPLVLERLAKAPPAAVLALRFGGGQGRLRVDDGEVAVPLEAGVDG